jgi:asparaginyl-tRNA synthetase
MLQIKRLFLSFHTKSNLASSILVKNQLKFFQTKSIKSLLDDLDHLPNAMDVRVIGWVKSFRDQKEIKFIHLNDGTDERHLQLVLLKENFAKNNDEFSTMTSTRYTFNTSVEACGRLVASESKQQKQRVELHVTEMRPIVECDPLLYPFQIKKNYTMEQMRQHLHLRSHLNAFR